jgi:hypothetical protein
LQKQPKNEWYEKTFTFTDNALGRHAAAGTGMANSLSGCDVAGILLGLLFPVTMGKA